jgi:RNA recognition motif-containing protein
MTNRGDGSSRDFGFIRFPNEQEAQTAIDMFNQTQYVHTISPSAPVIFHLILYVEAIANGG